MIAARALLTQTLRDEDGNIVIEEGRPHALRNNNLGALDHAIMLIYFNIMFFLTIFFLYIFVTCFNFGGQTQSETNRMLGAHNDSFYLPSSTTVYYNF